MSFSRRYNRNPNWKPPELTLTQTKKKIMDLLARRDHSLKELTDKLKERTSPETLQQALTWAKEQNWLPSNERLQEQVVRQLQGRKKGLTAINIKLKKMGLPTVKLEADTELETALQALKAKFKSDLLLNLEYKEFIKLKAKVMRHLGSRGFSSAVISRAIKQYFINSHKEDIC